MVAFKGGEIVFVVVVVVVIKRDDGWIDHETGLCVEIIMYRQTDRERPV